jgi:hypothetical protein
MGAGPESLTSRAQANSPVQGRPRHAGRKCLSCPTKEAHNIPVAYYKTVDVRERADNKLGDLFDRAFAGVLFLHEIPFGSFRRESELCRTAKRFTGIAKPLIAS